MKSFKFILMTLALGLMSISPQAFADDKGTIGISMPTKSSARWIADGDNIVKTLKSKGTKLICNMLKTTFLINWRRSRI